MKIRVLPSAVKDLAKGRRFYARQGEGLGNYFLDLLYSDIDSLALYTGIHLKVGKHHRLLSKRFLTPFTIGLPTRESKCGVCWTAVVTRAKSNAL